MKVIIVNFGANETVEYAACSRDDCRDEMDKMAYDLACEHGEIRMGQVWAYTERTYK